ncbi:hypothetical protein [Streptomyces phaeochromogenes]|uniref:hypothetical protein n=1 Tax=Streptomyces phaeochromogenes TaxID=1923 RepID=UPI0033C10DAB
MQAQEQVEAVAPHPHGHVDPARPLLDPAPQHLPEVGEFEEEDRQQAVGLRTLGLRTRTDGK